MQKFNKTSFKIRQRTNIAAKLYGNDTYLIPLLWKVFMISSAYTKTEEQNFRRIIVDADYFTGTWSPDPPFSSFGPSRDYGMDLCLEVYIWTIYPYVTTLSF
jgi:hypothetical protein